MEKLAETLRNHVFDWDENEFFDFFVQPDGTFRTQETSLWDFKESWPFSYSDEYFCGIAKLISAFANTSGGLVVFGIDDSTRKIKRSKVRVNVDRLCQALANCLSRAPSIKHVQFRTSGKNVDVLAVFPIKPGDLPLRFIVSFHRAPKGSMWVRVGHETVHATPRHIPFLFCRSGIQDDDQPAQLVESSLPPTPTTIKQFVGRLNVIYEVFDWIYNSRNPRNFLYGRGGSGKTSIAYEIAKHISEYGSGVFVDRKRPVDAVIFVSAKELELDPHTLSQKRHLTRDFESERELYEAILTLGGWIAKGDLNELTTEQLLAELEQFFDSICSFIVIDDIDTLTTKGQDPGLDSLYLTLARAKSPSKVLYTLRNAPTHSLSNSIEVPGLDAGEEYRRFVQICCEQFRVPAPSDEFRDTRLQEVSERRPLIVESIIALRRNSANYEQAVQLFEQHGGDDAREYVFKREWDALPADNRARHLLAAMAILDQAVTAEDLQTMLQYNIEIVVDAIADCKEMFLNSVFGSEETAFRIGSLTRSFILKQSEQLDFLPVIEARVDAFRKGFYPENPDLSRIQLRAERLIKIAKANSDAHAILRAWRELTSPTLGPAITEDPRYRAFVGYIATELEPPKIAEARDAFSYALSMRYEPDIHYLRRWYLAEMDSGIGGEYCEKIVEFVGKAKTYSELDKIDFQVLRASRLYSVGKDLRFTDVERSIVLLSEAIKVHLKTFRRAVEASHPRVVKSEEYARNTGFLLFRFSGDEMIRMRCCNTGVTF